MNISTTSKIILTAATVFLCIAADAIFPERETTVAAQGRPLNQSGAEAEAKSAGCITCHTSTDEPSMHPTGTVRLGCADCHGGNAEIRVAQEVAAGGTEYLKAKRAAHPSPRLRASATSAANPVRAYTEWLRESAEYIQFINPGDLRVADRTCGTCHPSEVQNV